MLFVDLAGVFSHGQAEARFALAGAAGDDQQIAGLQPAEQPIEIDESGRHADRLVAVARQVIDAVVVFREHAFDGLKLVGETSLAHTEDRFFRIVDDLFDRGAGLVGKARDRVGGFQQPAAGGGLLDRAGIRLGMQ